MGQNSKLIAFISDFIAIIFSWERKKFINQHILILPIILSSLPIIKNWTNKLNCVRKELLLFIDLICGWTCFFFGTIPTQAQRFYCCDKTPSPSLKEYIVHIESSGVMWWFLLILFWNCFYELYQRRALSVTDSSFFNSNPDRIIELC